METSSLVKLVKLAVILLGCRLVQDARAFEPDESIQTKWSDVSSKAGKIPTAPELTSTLVAWLSSQSEGIIEEMEAIAKQNAESNQFSVVNYLRFLNLFDSLEVIANRPIDELKWVRKKIGVFNRHGIYQDALNMVTNYLQDLDTKLSKIELNEPKSKQLAVSKEWLVLYESILYIATHAPKKSGLGELAASYLTSSPDGTKDKVRSTRYHLKTNSFSR